MIFNAIKLLRDKLEAQILSSLGRERYICAHALHDLRIDHQGISVCCFNPFLISHHDYLNSPNLFDEERQNLIKNIIQGDYHLCPAHCHVRQTARNEAAAGRYVYDYTTRQHRWMNERYRPDRYVVKNICLAFDDRCQQKCSMCYKQKTTQRIDRSLCDQLWIRGAELVRNTDSLGFGGSGEPLCQEQTLSILRQPPDSVKRLSIVTNGILLTPELISTFPSITKRILHLQVSLDAASEESYQRVRGGYPFIQLIEQLRAIRPLITPRPTLSFVVQESNFRDLPEFIRLAKELDCAALLCQLRGDESDQWFLNQAVQRPNHPDHKHFMAILSALNIADFQQPILYN